MFSKKDMNKVLHIIYPQPGSNIGGSDLYILELSEMFNLYTKCECSILYTRRGGLSDLIKKRNIRAFFLDEKENNFIKSAFYLNKLLGELRPNMVHTHGYDANYLIAVYKILKKIFRWPEYGCVFAATTHGWIKEPFEILLKTYLDYLTIPFFDGIVVVDPKQKDLINRFRRKKTIVKYIKTAVRISSPAVIRKCKKHNHLLQSDPPKEINMAFIGRLSPEKRVYLAISVYKEIIKSVPCFRGLIIGGGSERKRVISSLKNDNPKNRIIFKGYLDKDKTEKEFNNIDILLITSDSEGCPRVALEAMSTKTLVVSRQVGYMGKLIGKNERGLLLTSSEPQIIAQEILEFITQPKNKIRDILSSAESYVVTNHSPEKFIDEHLKFYTKVYENA